MSTLHFSLFAFFAAFAFVLYDLGNEGIAVICFGVCFIVAVHWFWIKFKEQAGKANDKVKKGLEEEWKKIEGAKGNWPTIKFWEDNAHALGKKSAEALFAEDEEKFTMPQPVSKISKSSQSFIDAFYKLFKK